MRSTRGAFRRLSGYVDTEAAIWVAVLVFVGLGNPNSDTHLTLFWPYYVWGIESPGHGLGHSIGHFFRGDVAASIGSHLLGVPAVAILGYRIISLTRRRVAERRND